MMLASSRRRGNRSQLVRQIPDTIPSRRQSGVPESATASGDYQLALERLKAVYFGKLVAACYPDEIDAVLLEMHQGGQ
ncbi:MAG: hypothetical protein KDA72_10200 [Planctomycetales bacterium]|nr:hypothetical protein [Planctomycetales bacterium]